MLSSWENGFINREEYFSKRQKLQKEIESLRPIDYDELTQAADLLHNFNTYWFGCSGMKNPEEVRRQLVQKIVERVFVYDDQIVAVDLHGNYTIVLEQECKTPVIFTGVLEDTLSSNAVEISCSQLRERRVSITLWLHSNIT